MRRLAGSAASSAPPINRSAIAPLKTVEVWMLGKIAWSFLFACSALVAYGVFTKSYERTAARYDQAQQFKSDKLRQGSN